MGELIKIVDQGNFILMLNKISHRRRKKLVRWGLRAQNWECLFEAIPSEEDVLPIAEIVSILDISSSGVVHVQQGTTEQYALYRIDNVNIQSR